MLVVEAKDRVGGRTQTIDIPSSKPGQTAKWDIGAQWVTDSQKNVTKLMKELNIETYKQFTTGNKVLESCGKRTVFNSAYPYTSFLSWLDMRLYMKRVDMDVVRLNTLHPYADKELAERLEAQTFKDYLFSKAYTPTVRSVIRSNMSSCFGFELEQGKEREFLFEYPTYIYKFFTN
jgi:monoamine oxidase